MQYYGVFKWPRVDGIYGMELERMDDSWLQRSGKRLLGYGEHLPLQECVTARILLRQSATWLHPDHGQINGGDLMVVLHHGLVVRACIIDHDDQPDRLDQGKYNIHELGYALEERGLGTSKGIGRDCLIFFWYKVLFQRNPLSAFLNLILLAAYILNSIEDHLLY